MVPTGFTFANTLTLTTALSGRYSSSLYRWGSQCTEGLRDLPKGTQLMYNPVKMIPGYLAFHHCIISKTGSEAGQTQRRHLGCGNGRKWTHPSHTMVQVRQCPWMSFAVFVEPLTLYANYESVCVYLHIILVSKFMVLV